MKYGNDISKYQTDDVVRLLYLGGKAQFIIMRSTVGTYTVDSSFPKFMQDVKKYKFRYGFYHAAYAGTVEEAVMEADFCIDTIERFKATKDEISLPVFYDYEYFSVKYNEERGIITTPQLVRDLTLAFCGRVKERGYPTGVYLNKDFWDRFYGIDFFVKNPDLKIWYARPGLCSPHRECYLWQYSSGQGTEFGYPYAIDQNLLFGEFINTVVNPVCPLSQELVRLFIGYASPGDVITLTQLISSLGINTHVNNGYITTGYVSRGDQCTIIKKCNELGIPCVIYNQQPCVCDCDALAEENEQLRIYINEKKDKNKALNIKNTQMRERADNAAKCLHELICEIDKIIESLK